MSNQFGFVSEETFAEKMDTQNRFLAALVDAQGGSLKPTSWNNAQALVRTGLAGKSICIADQFTCQKSNSNLVWDVIGINHDTPTDQQFRNSLTLQLHDLFPNQVQFDAPEAFYYCESELPAGTYCFSIVGGIDQTYQSFNNYQFTLEHPVPAGGQLCFGWGYQVYSANAKVSSYESSISTTAIESVSVTEGTSGTSLGTLTGSGDAEHHLNSIYL